MTFIHLGATMAAAAVSNMVGFSWTDTPPYSQIRVDDGGDGFWGKSVFVIGDQVVYHNTAGSPPTPLVDQDMYSVRKISNDRISLGTNLSNINAIPSFINLTFTGTGHAFQRIGALAPVDFDMDTST